MESALAPQPRQSVTDNVVSLQEKVLLWLLQFMQEQAISLDEIDQNGNTAVHVAAQYGHLTCIQVSEMNLSSWDYEQDLMGELFI